MPAYNTTAIVLKLAFDSGSKIHVFAPQRWATSLNEDDVRLHRRFCDIAKTLPLESSQEGPRTRKSNFGVCYLPDHPLASDVSSTASIPTHWKEFAADAKILEVGRGYRRSHFKKKADFRGLGV